MDVYVVASEIGKTVLSWASGRNAMSSPSAFLVRGTGIPESKKREPTTEPCGTPMPGRKLINVLAPFKAVCPPIDAMWAYATAVDGLVPRVVWI